MKSIFEFNTNRISNAAEVISRRALAPGSTQNFGHAKPGASALRLIRTQTSKADQ